MLNYLDFFSKARVLVVGDVMLDRYWQGDTSRISPEAPVPVVHVHEQEHRLGGAGNVAVNIRALGAQACLLAACGQDEAGSMITQQLTDHAIEHRLQQHVENTSVTKLRVLSRHQQLMRLDFEAPQLTTDEVVLLQDVTRALADTGLLILSDYGKGTIADPQLYIQAARAQQVPVLIDPKGKDFNRYRGATLLTPNRKEFEMIVGVCQNEADLVAKGLQALKTYDLQALLVTRGEEGMTLLREGQPPLHLSARAREVFDVTGAGDTVIATLGTGLAAGIPLEQAIALANMAASITVSRIGAVSVSVPELRRAIQTSQGVSAGVMSREELLTAVADAQALGERIVMTNGCFDLLHAGHVSYLKQAKTLGDRLIVAVNDDASVKRLKGSRRPINALSDRMSLLSSLEAVDWVVPFSEDTPADLISAVLPDVLVKGGDYKVSEIAGADEVIARGGDVTVLNFVPGFSSSKIIEIIMEDVQ